MSYMLPHLHNGWQVDQAILSEEDRVIVIRFGHDWDPTCMKMDEVLYSIAEKVFTVYQLEQIVFGVGLVDEDVFGNSYLCIIILVCLISSVFLR